VFPKDPFKNSSDIANLFICFSLVYPVRGYLAAMLLLFLLQHPIAEAEVLDPCPVYTSITSVTFDSAYSNQRNFIFIKVTVGIWNELNQTIDLESIWEPTSSMGCGLHFDIRSISTYYFSMETSFDNCAFFLHNSIPPGTTELNRTIIGYYEGTEPTSELFTIGFHPLEDFEAQNNVLGNFYTVTFNESQKDDAVFEEVNPNWGATRAPGVNESQFIHLKINSINTITHETYEQRTEFTFSIAAELFNTGNTLTIELPNEEQADFYFIAETSYSTEQASIRIFDQAIIESGVTLLMTSIGFAINARVTRLPDGMYTFNFTLACGSNYTPYVLQVTEGVEEIQPQSMIAGTCQVSLYPTDTPSNIYDPPVSDPPLNDLSFPVPILLPFIVPALIVSYQRIRRFFAKS
jgi:hypothetical protein